MAGFLLSVTRGAYCSTSSAKIWLDTVVPMFEPMMTPSDCGNVTRPPLTSAITRMMVTDEESRRVVATAPVSTAARRLVVNRPSSPRARSLASGSIAVASWKTPNRKRTSPPRTFRKMVAS